MQYRDTMKYISIIMIFSFMLLCGCARDNVEDVHEQNANSKKAADIVEYIDYTYSQLEEGLNGDVEKVKENYVGKKISIKGKIHWIDAKQYRAILITENGKATDNVRVICNTNGIFKTAAAYAWDKYEKEIVIRGTIKNIRVREPDKYNQSKMIDYIVEPDEMDTWIHNVNKNDEFKPENKYDMQNYQQLHGNLDTTRSVLDEKIRMFIGKNISVQGIMKVGEYEKPEENYEAFRNLVDKGHPNLRYKCIIGGDDIGTKHGEIFRHKKRNDMITIKGNVKNIEEIPTNGDSILIYYIQIHDVE